MVECVCGNRQYRHLCLCCGDRLLMIWVFFARWTICLCENVRWKPKSQVLNCSEREFPLPSSRGQLLIDLQFPLPRPLAHPLLPLLLLYLCIQDPLLLLYLCIQDPPLSIPDRVIFIIHAYVIINYGSIPKHTFCTAVAGSSATAYMPNRVRAVKKQLICQIVFVQ